MMTGNCNCYIWLGKEELETFQKLSQQPGGNGSCNVQMNSHCTQCTQQLELTLNEADLCPMARLSDHKLKTGRQNIINQEKTRQNITDQERPRENSCGQNQLLKPVTFQLFRHVSTRKVPNKNNIWSTRDYFVDLEKTGRGFQAVEHMESVRVVNLLAKYFLWNFSQLKKRKVAFNEIRVCRFFV